MASSSAAVLLGLVVLAMFVTGPSHSEAQLGEVNKGKAAFFTRCVGCHEPPSTVGLTEDEIARNEAALPADETEAVPTRGPSLSELFGRRAGSLPDYQYSDAMKTADVIWTEDTLQLYLQKPAAFIPKNKMPFNGLKREGEMENLIAYLKQAMK
ncbi:MAG: c-type cytochrome [Paracoccaceae bacterium]